MEANPIPILDFWRDTEFIQSELWAFRVTLDRITTDRLKIHIWDDKTFFTTAGPTFYHVEIFLRKKRSSLEPTSPVVVTISRLPDGHEEPSLVDLSTFYFLSQRIENPPHHAIDHTRGFTFGTVKGETMPHVLSGKNTKGVHHHLFHPCSQSLTPPEDSKIRLELWNTQYHAFRNISAYGNKDISEILDPWPGENERTFTPSNYELEKPGGVMCRFPAWQDVGLWNRPASAHVLPAPEEPLDLSMYLNEETYEEQGGGQEGRVSEYRKDGGRKAS